MGGVLVSFAIPKGPSPDPDEKRLAVHVEAHPVEYADFEGVIPDDNYGAGPSIVWDRGAWVDIEDPKHGMEQGKLLFDLHGHKLRGRWTLVRLKGSGKEWLLIKKPDAHATKEVPPYKEESILSGVKVEDLAAVGGLSKAVREELIQRKVPRRKVEVRTVELMLAETAPKPFSQQGWWFELKYDGYRLLASNEGGAPFLRYRRGNDVTTILPELARALKGLPYEVLLDGELVVLDERGHPSFQKLQKRVQLQGRQELAHAEVALPATFFAFDLLSLEGHDLRDLALSERKRWLRRVLPPVGAIRYSDHVEALGAELFVEARKLGLEGVMGKRADAPYKRGRRPEWLKVRGEHSGEFAVVGYTVPEGNRLGFGALDLAVWDGKAFVYAGSVGTGFSDALLESLHRELEARRRATPAFVGKPVPGRKHVWVDPEVVVEVAYFDWTSDGMLRHPKFVRMREDKAVTECRAPGGKGVELEVRPALEGTDRKVVVSNPKKIFWPDDGLTKGDLVAYYREVSPWLLPYLRDRPVVMTRFPDGIHGKSFFQKDAPPFVPEWLRRVRVWSEGTAREIDYFVCDDAEAIAYLANLGTLPLHVWSSRVGTLQAPDWSILDLDPKGAPFKDVVRVALKIRELCEAIELPSFVKTSGSSGLHVLLPMGEGATYEQSRGLAELISRVVVTALPDLCTLERVIQAREGKVYLDCLQNGHGKLLVSPFSVRPLPSAPVSMPLKWSEVKVKNHPQAFTMKTAVRRMKKLAEDPMVGVLKPGPALVGVLKRLEKYLERSS